MASRPPLPPPDNTFDASDPKEIKKADDASKIRAEERRQVAAAILGSIQGREWLWSVLKDLHTFDERISVTGSEYEHGYFSGQRDGGLRLMRLFAKSDPANFATLFKEHD